MTRRVRSEQTPASQDDAASERNPLTARVIATYAADSPLDGSSSDISGDISGGSVSSNHMSGVSSPAMRLKPLTTTNFTTKSFTTKSLIHERIIKNEEDYHIDRPHVNLHMLGDSPPLFAQTECSSGGDSGTATAVASPLMVSALSSNNDIGSISVPSFAYEENIRRLVLSECIEDAQDISRLVSSDHFKPSAGALLSGQHINQPDQDSNQDMGQNCSKSCSTTSCAKSRRFSKANSKSEPPKKKHEAQCSGYSSRRKSRKNISGLSDPLDEYRFGRLELDDKEPQIKIEPYTMTGESANEHFQAGSNNKSLDTCEPPNNNKSREHSMDRHTVDDSIPAPSYFPDFNPEDWLTQSPSNKLKHGILVSDFPVKSRVETQIRIALHIYPPPQELLVHLPTDTISKPKLQLKTPFIPNRNCLMLETIVVCSSNLKQYANMCRGCINREQKRASRKKVRLPVEEAHWREGVERRVIVFNCREVMNFSDETSITVNGKEVKSKKLELPMRLACYCRHHNEKIGFRVFFVLKNFEGKVVGRGVSNAVMITDDHKAGGALDPAVNGAGVGIGANGLMNLDNLSALDRMNVSLDALNSSGTVTSANTTDSEMAAAVPVAAVNSGNHHNNKKPLSTIASPELNPSFGSHYGNRLSQVIKIELSSTSGDSTSQTSPVSHPISPPSLKSDPSTAASSPLLSAFTRSEDPFNKGAMQEGMFPEDEESLPQEEERKEEEEDPFHDKTSFLASSSLLVDLDDTNNEDEEFHTREAITIANTNYRNTNSMNIKNRLSNRGTGFFSNTLASNSINMSNNMSASSMMDTDPSAVASSSSASATNDVTMLTESSASTSGIPSPSSADNLFSRAFCNFEGPLPTIKRVIPTSGPLRGGIEVTLLGSGFVNGLVAKFGGNRSVATHCWNSTTIVAHLPPAQLAGPVQVNFEGWTSSESPVFHYYDDTDKQLVELALQVIGLKMSGRVQDAREVAKKIIGSNQPSLRELRRQLSEGLNESEGRTKVQIQPNTTLEDMLIKCLREKEESDYTYNYDLTNREGQSMLHLAAILGFENLCAVLIDLGCVLDIKDKSGYSSLHFAMLNKYYSLAHLLLQNGADLFSTTFTGIKVLDLCADETVCESFTGQYLSMSPYNSAVTGSLTTDSEEESLGGSLEDLPPAYDEIYPTGSSYTINYDNAVIDEPCGGSSSSPGEKTETEVVENVNQEEPSEEQIWQMLVIQKRQVTSDKRLFFFWLPIFLMLTGVLYVECTNLLHETEISANFKHQVAVFCKGLIGIRKQSMAH